MLYAMRFLGGPRPGEAANARWRNLDRTKRPLWRLTLESSFNSPMRREKATKTGATLNIPIHPVLQRHARRPGRRAAGPEFMGRDAAARRPHLPARRREAAAREHELQAVPRRPRDGRPRRPAAVRVARHLPEPRPQRRRPEVPGGPHHPPEADAGTRTSTTASTCCGRGCARRSRAIDPGAWNGRPDFTTRAGYT